MILAFVNCFCPSASRWASICSHTSFLISTASHSFAGLPYSMPGVSQSEISTDRMPFTSPSP